MKKASGFLFVIFILIVAAILLFGKLGIGFGFGAGSGNGTGEGNGTTNTTQEEAVSDSEKETVESEDKTAASEEGTILEISVVKSDYFYENKSISLDDLMEIIKSIDGKVVVQIADDNASLKAYNKLLDALEEIGVSYIEETVER